MIDDEARIGVAVDQRRARIHVAPAQDVDRKVALYGRAQDPVEARVIRLALRLLRHDDADADRAGCLLPVGDDIVHGWIVWVDRLDDRERDDSCCPCRTDVTRRRHAPSLAKPLLASCSNAFENSGSISSWRHVRWRRSAPSSFSPARARRRHRLDLD